MSATRHCLPRLVAPLAVAAALAATALPAAALYKVVNPDGSVTYTDRPPVDNTSRITTMSRSGRPAANAPPEAALPAGLREAAQRWPVTLYTAVECSACEGSRQWLAQRGIPYAEKRVLTEEDALALERIVGGRSVPSLSIGAQPLRGFSETDWVAYLDVAGYPVLGDKIYGVPESIFLSFDSRGTVDDEMMATLLLPRHALHAASIELRHPATNAPLRIESPLPSDLASVLTRLANGGSACPPAGDAEDPSS